MNRLARCFQNWPCVFACAALCGIGLVPRPATAAAGNICRGCVESSNDTTSTPGKTATSMLVMGQAQNPAVAFVGTDHLLRCAMPQSPGWQIQTVDPLSAAAGCSMVLDAQSEPMIAYHDANGLLFLAHRVSGAWVSEPVDPSGGAFGGTSIARVDGGVGIAYAGTAAGALKYAERIGSEPWSIEFVSPAGEPGLYPSLVADGPMRAISYYDPAQGGLHLAMRQAGAGWAAEMVDGTGDVGGYSSLVGGAGVSGFGIAYYDFANADLKYAHQMPGGWMTETVEGAGVSVGRFCSAFAFANTPDDLVGIAYYDQTHGDLKYALKHGPAWTITPLDTAGDVGGSIACGGTPLPADTIGMVYVDRQSGDLLYQWHAGTVTSAPMPAARNMPLRVEWLRSAAGAAGRARFTVPVAGEVRVAFYDAAGRVVAIPLRRTLPAGPAEVRWDGRDERGRAVRSGVLFVRVETPGGAGAVPVVVLR